MKKVLLSIILLIAVVQGTWATAYKYYIVEKSGSTLFFKGSDTAPSGKFQWNITDNSLKKWTWLDENLRGSVIFDDGAMYNNVYYSTAPAVFPKSGVTTDIQSVDNGQWTMDHSWYTLDGRKLSEKPTQKGIYIFNGKKVMINS